MNCQTSDIRRSIVRDKIASSVCKGGNTGVKRFLIPNMPLYLGVKKVLLEEIRSGRMAANGRLPSEEVLARQFNVSRATIRSTLQSLEKDGIVTRRHGIGTFLNADGLQVKMRIDEAKGFFQLIRDSGHAPSISESKLTRVFLGDRISDLMGLPRNQEAVLLERLFLGDGQPAVFVAEYIPAASLLHEPQLETIPESIFEFAEVFCRDSIAYSITEIIPVKADDELKKKIGLGRGEVLLKLEELHYTKENRPFIFSSVYVSDRIIRFQVLRRRHQF